ncbi:MAG: hypothetical protein ABH862_05745 [Candidatus Omnitrophota bacterium]
MKKTVIFKIILVVWVVLWLFFLVREDKDDQYASLKRLYMSDHLGKTKIIMGDDLYDFLNFCKNEIPENSTYKIAGFEKFSIFEVRSRYFLWPLRAVEENANYIILYGKPGISVPGYEMYKDYKGIGSIYRKK